MRTGLVVDGSPITRRILGLMVSRLGFAIVEADTGEQALSACQETTPELALIDWTLPDDDGISLVQQLRRLPGGEKIKVIMCTSERSVTQIEAAVAAGADEYVTKPFGLEVLQTKLSYLGFDLGEEGVDSNNAQSLRLRRLVSRVGLAGMTLADREVADFTSGATIFREGDAPDFAYIILSGQVQSGARQRRIGPLALFGEQALIDSSPRRHDAVAITDCQAMRISRAAFQSELATASAQLRNWTECLFDQLGDETE